MDWEKNLWCNMSPVFSGNFLIASFSQEIPCQKVEAHIVQVEGTASQTMQPMQVHDGTAFWKSFVGVEQIKWPIRQFVQFPNYVPYPELELCFLWKNGSGSSASHPIGSCFLSDSYS